MRQVVNPSRKQGATACGTLPKSIYLETGTRNGMPENKLRETGITEVLPVFDKANLIPYCVAHIASALSLRTARPRTPTTDRTMAAITIALLSPVALMTAEEEAVSGLEAEATEPSVASFHCVVPETPLAEAVGTTATSLPETTTSMFRLMPASLKIPPTWLRAVLTAVRTSVSLLALFSAFTAWVRELRRVAELSRRARS